jgi:hypothetical protein
MKYEKAEYFEGDLAKAIDVAKNTFLPNGFEIISSSNSNLEVSNRSYVWGYNQHPLNGVSKVYISGSDGKIIIKAELGGVTKMLQYLILFMGGMMVFFLIFFGIQLHVQGQPINKLLRMIWAPFAPWPIAIPLMGVWFKKRADRALDTLLKNMISSGKA